MSEGDAADNSPVDAPAALLIAPDPSGQSDMQLEHIRDLSQEDYDRYQLEARATMNREVDCTEGSSRDLLYRRNARQGHDFRLGLSYECRGG